MKEIIDKVLEELDKGVDLDYEGDRAKFSKPGYDAYEIKKDNFHELDAVGGAGSICFVDGGNIEIMGSANFSLQLVRAYGCVFSENKKKDEMMDEFFLLVRSFGEGEIKYRCEIFPVKGDVSVDAEDMEFDSMDATIKDGVFRAEISKIGEVVRRFSELKLAEKIVSGLEEGDVVVLDGTLEGNYECEEKYLDGLYMAGNKRGVVVCALAKTARMFTEKGNNLIGLLNSIGDEKKWYYNPIVDISDKKHKAEMYVLRLNEKARYVFRFEVCSEQKHDINRVAGMIAANSSDLMFPGYPYGLIVADKFARVSKKEKEHYFSLLMAKMGRKGENMAKYLSSSNAHSILDGKN